MFHSTACLAHNFASHGQDTYDTLMKDAPKIVTFDAGTRKNKGLGLALYYHTYPTPLGICLVATSDQGITNILFGNSARIALTELRARWPHATLLQKHLPIHDQAQTCITQGSASNQKKATSLPTLHLSGTPFQLVVWRTLLSIPSGHTTTYADLAAKTGTPHAHRAVGTAVGANPIAVLIPCHRVLRTDGTIGGYRWGEKRKRALLEQEGVALTNQ